MHDYIVKSIHDQRMRQFMVEAERAHLVRQLRKSRPARAGFARRLAGRVNETLGAFAAGLQAKRLST
ncbi:MAG TPA: hypothetical protein VMP13_09275 [Acidimicrobiia bacterium]|nr:hypothetical protein [Acidimicrobiia bacterium]